MARGKKLNLAERIAYRILKFTDIENITLRRAVRDFAQTVPQKARILDAAAGLKPYEELFNHCQYESCDFGDAQEFYGNLEDGTRENISERHTYVCPIEKIPVADETFDFVLCTQVLEHVPDPLAAAIEMRRVLKRSGKLFLTVPQGYGIHGEPYNFFYFTKFGVDLILSKAGFEVIKTTERGGYFYYLFDRVANAIPRIVTGYKQMSLMMLALSPIHIILAYIIGPTLLILEPLDREKRFTLGYVSIAQK